MSKTEPTDINKKMAQLNEYIAWFESDDFAIEQSLEKFSEAQKLADEIQADLDSFKNKIEIVKKQFDKD
jgi:exodeoxyribonuclease VII small subunit